MKEKKKSSETFYVHLQVTFTFQYPSVKTCASLML